MRNTTHVTYCYYREINYLTACNRLRALDKSERSLCRLASNILIEEFRPKQFPVGKITFSILLFGSTYKSPQPSYKPIKSSWPMIPFGHMKIRNCPIPELSDCLNIFFLSARKSDRLTLHSRITEYPDFIAKTSGISPELFADQARSESHCSRSSSRILPQAPQEPYV